MQVLGVLLPALLVLILSSPPLRTTQTVESFMSSRAVRQSRQTKDHIVKQLNPSCIIVEPQYYPPNCQQALTLLKESPVETHAYVLQEALTQFCTNICLQPQLQFWRYCIHNESMVRYYEDFVCAGNSKGFCLVQLQFSQGYLQCGISTYCPEECRNNYLHVKGQLGCCFGTLFDPFSPYGGLIPHTFINYYELLVCSIDPGEHCKSLYNNAGIADTNSYLTVLSILCVLAVSMVVH